MSASEGGARMEGNVELLSTLAPATQSPYRICTLDVS